MNRQTSKKSGRQGRKRSAKTGLVPRAQPEYLARTAENRAALASVRALRGPNDKYINTLYNALSGTATTTAAFVATLNGVAPGTSENNRIGRLCRMKWLDIDFTVYPSTVTPAVADWLDMRAYIIVETTALGSQLQPQQFLVDNVIFAPNSQRDRTTRNAQRYVVLWDSGIIPLGVVSSGNSANANTPVTVGALPAEKAFSLHIPLGFTTDYSRGSNGNITDIDTNSLSLMLLSDGTAGSSAMNIGGAWTLCFQDDK